MKEDINLRQSLDVDSVTRPLSYGRLAIQMRTRITAHQIQGDPKQNWYQLMR